MQAPKPPRRDPVELENENQQLREQLDQSQRRIEQLERDKQNLNRNIERFFLIPIEVADEDAECPVGVLVPAFKCARDACAGIANRFPSYIRPPPSTTSTCPVT